MTNAIQNEKEVKYEACRIIACILVVLSHVAEQWPAHNTPSNIFCIDEWQVANAINCFTRCGAPLFVMISGAFMLDNCRDINVRKNIKKLSVKLAYWWIFYGIGNYILFGFIFHQKMTILEIIRGDLVTWSYVVCVHADWDVFSHAVAQKDNS